MSDYQIITDATCDIDPNLLNKYEVAVIPMNVLFEYGESFEHYPDFRNYSAEAFYNQLRQGHTTSSTQITPMQYISFFEQYLKQGTDILYICLTKSLSNTFESSLLAMRELREKYPGRKMHSMDSLCASGGEGILAVEAGKNRRNGMSLEDNIDWLNLNTHRLAHYFTVSDLTYLKRGGRISPATAVIGNALNIKPILYVNDEGKLVMLGTAHGRKASIKKLIKMTQETIEDGEHQTLYVLHADCPDEAEALKQTVLQEFSCRDVVISRVGPVIGTHVGPDMIALLSFGSGRKPQK